MLLKTSFLKIGLFMLLFSSCIVRSPKYSTLEQVNTLKVGMTRAAVEETLGIEPYNIKEVTDSGNTYIYVYRVKVRQTIGFSTQPTNGKEAIGKYMQMAVSYTKDERVRSMESCILCPDNLVTTSRIDVDKVLLFVTVTLPVLLVFFGLK